VTFPSNYDPNKGLRAGRVFELRCFFKVKPGHVEQLKAACALPGSRSTVGDAKAMEEGVNLVGIHEDSATLFDNDTRFLFTTAYDSEWDPYMAEWDPYTTDVVRLVGGLRTTISSSTARGVPEGIDPKTLPADYFQGSLQRDAGDRSHVPEDVPGTVREITGALKLQKAFQQVLDHPDAAKGLEHPALKPLLELAAD
jgi:hypothetical protein